ncbi:putative NADAR family protein [Monocercomonoides exilis]|uniref:putative NADAR family protein n=1 Tax=Monocercomonoides exilis TaxID=2049356 RepID=UPI003559C7A9|nr:putative NADAR family protein [Monocercomonoides exilis]|eukprot:MONOS_14735.1-p1 / transcript=MONOS_14735.1 / gene=MONOS_14735 / organism=Monocercomonoides_exilis_PA203 / gene_product=PF08719 domain protein / transcript_product=PF08719 domain protein / location=Mono_scaffold01061:7702-8313(+) / protein_length=203 / sequence_SO=supercontig / SO=protein_coding / is_pseudo=false
MATPSSVPSTSSSISSTLSPRNVHELIERCDKGQEFSYIFFWKESEDPYGIFAQWFTSPFVVDSIRYNTAEHWMMAEKARLFNDDVSLQNILKASTPRKAKELGRGVKNFNGTVWEQKKFDIVYQGNLHKFSQHPELKALLMETKSSIIVEASPLDAIWGIKMAASNPKATNPHEWKGENVLGFAIMAVRDTFFEQLKESSKS